MTRPQDATRWTAQQETAIVHRGSDVFVAASAGTGKTAVLTGRCARLLSDRALCPSVLNVLVVTFTDAAAEQMRTRIGAQLEREAAASPDNRHLANQILLLPAADISTIHAFCKRLLTDHFFELGLDGGFRVIDPDEQSLLKAEALDRTCVWAWDQPDLQEGLESLFGRRSVSRFAQRIVWASDFLDTLADRHAWMARTLEQARISDPLQTQAAQHQRQMLTETLNRLSDQVHWLQSQWDRLQGGGEFAGEALAEELGRCVELSRAGNWEGLSEHLRSVRVPGLARGNDEDSGMAGTLRHGIHQAASELARLTDLAVLDTDYGRQVRPLVQLQTRTFVTLVAQFDEIYSQLKAQHNGLDFADLEHYALRLLSDPQDPSRPSDTALALQARYKAIFVDEYQDINGVQQAILDRLRGSGNVFGVGDVKQSIYAFRGAEPGIFLEILRPGPGSKSGVSESLRVDLNVNFRSSQAILDFVNELFARIMTESHAGLDYDESARLAAPPGRQQAPGPAVELHLIDEIRPATAGEGEEEVNPRQVTDRQRQASLIAQRIRQMVGATGERALQIQDPETGVERDLQYRDIVVLLRSPAGRVQDYERVLRLAGIPVVAPSSGFFAATEVGDCLNLLKVLDNPYRDIELAAVLRSPLFNVSDTELAQVKLHTQSAGRKRPFYEAVAQSTRNAAGEPLSVKLIAIFEKLESWRQRARVTALAEVLWQVYEETGLTSFVLALPDGRIRKANLLKLHERAIQFDRFSSSQGFVSLGRFVEFIEKLQATGSEWGAAEPQGLGQDAVRIQSIHKSKGLEFPVVFLAELDAEFNRADAREDVLFDARELLGLQVVDPQHGARMASIEHQVIAARLSRRDLAEEMRILYVAVTRARQRLILTGVLSQRQCRQTLLLGRTVTDKAVAAATVGQFRSPLHWILYGCSHRPELLDAFDMGGQDNPGAGPPLMAVQVHGTEEAEGLSRYFNGLRAFSRHRLPLAERPAQPASLSLASLQATLQWRYPHEQACACPAKRTVTGWVHQGQPEAAGISGQGGRAMVEGRCARAGNPTRLWSALPRIWSCRPYPWLVR